MATFFDRILEHSLTQENIFLREGLGIARTKRARTYAEEQKALDRVYTEGREEDRRRYGEERMFTKYMLDNIDSLVNSNSLKNDYVQMLDERKPYGDKAIGKAREDWTTQAKKNLTSKIDASIKQIGIGSEAGKKMVGTARFFAEDLFDNISTSVIMSSEAIHKVHNLNQRLREKPYLKSSQGFSNAIKNVETNAMKAAEASDNAVALAVKEYKSNVYDANLNATSIESIEAGGGAEAAWPGQTRMIHTYEFAKWLHGTGNFKAARDTFDILWKLEEVPNAVSPADMQKMKLQHIRQYATDYDNRAKKYNQSLTSIMKEFEWKDVPGTIVPFDDSQIIPDQTLFQAYDDTIKRQLSQFRKNMKDSATDAIFKTIGKHIDTGQYDMALKELAKTSTREELAEEIRSKGKYFDDEAGATMMVEALTKLIEAKKSLRVYAHYAHGKDVLRPASDEKTPAESAAGLIDRTKPKPLVVEKDKDLTEGGRPK